MDYYSKVCKKCGITKPKNEFGKNSASKDGLQTKCRDCDKAIQAERRTNKKEECLAYGRKYIAVKRKEHTWRLKQLLTQARVRANKKGRDFSIGLDDVLAIYPEDGLCPVFRTPLVWNSTGFRETSPSIDRINSDGGYTKGNIQVISWKANRIKGDASVHDLETLLKFLKGA